jgi:uncharacterized RDD family membrane protein YckC
MPTPSLPCSLADLLIVFAPCFTAPTFAAFRAMVAGFLTQPGPPTVTGMLAGAGWPVGATTTWPTDSLRPHAGLLTSSDCCCWSSSAPS